MHIVRKGKAAEEEHHGPKTAGPKTSSDITNQKT